MCDGRCNIFYYGPLLETNNLFALPQNENVRVCRLIYDPPSHPDHDADAKTNREVCGAVL